MQIPAGQQPQVMIRQNIPGAGVPQQTHQYISAPVSATVAGGSMVGQMGQSGQPILVSYQQQPQQSQPHPGQPQYIVQKAPQQQQEMVYGTSGSAMGPGGPVMGPARSQVPQPQQQHMSGGYMSSTPHQMNQGGAPGYGQQQQQQTTTTTGYAPSPGSSTSVLSTPMVSSSGVMISHQSPGNHHQATAGSIHQTMQTPSPIMPSQSVSAAAIAAAAAPPQQKLVNTQAPQQQTSAAPAPVAAATGGGGPRSVPDSSPATTGGPPSVPPTGPEASDDPAFQQLFKDLQNAYLPQLRKMVESQSPQQSMGLFNLKIDSYFMEILNHNYFKIH